MLSIPELEVQDELFWQLYKAFYILIKEGFSIYEFKIDKSILLHYRLKGKSVIITYQIPYRKWMICVNKYWGIVKNRIIINEYIEPKDLLNYVEALVSGKIGSVN